jgi:hypothetical protein
MGFNGTVGVVNDLRSPLWMDRVMRECYGGFIDRSNCNTK